MAFPDLEDWMLIDIKYKNEKDQEILRTVLYVLIEGNWRVGDSGTLLK
jgi:predicted nucleotidyltransferase